MKTIYVLLPPAGQLLLTAYQQPGRDVWLPNSGQTQLTVGAQTSPLDGPMRCREVPRKFPFTGHPCGTRLARQRSRPPRSGGLR